MFCKIYQWRIEKEMDEYGQIKNQGALRHLERCSGCQRWLQSLKKIEEQLKAASPKIPGSHMERVEAGVRERLSQARTGKVTATLGKRSRSYRFRFAVSAAAAVIAFVCGLFILYYTSKPDEATGLQTMDSVPLLPEKVRYQISDEAKLPEKMLKSEMRNMEADVHGAIKFVKNCFPQRRVASNLSLEDMD